MVVLAYTGCLFVTVLTYAQLTKYNLKRHSVPIWGALTSVEIFEELDCGFVERVAKLEGDAELQQLRGCAHGLDDFVLHAVPQVLAVQLEGSNIEQPSIS